MSLESIIASLGEHIADAIFIAEATPADQSAPKIAWCNHAFTNMTEYSASEVLGETISILMGPKSCPEAQERMAQQLNSKVRIQERIIFYKKNGKELWVDLDICPVGDHSSANQYWVAVQRDVSNQVQINEQMEATNRKLSLCIECGHIGVWEWNPSLGLIDYSKQNFELLGDKKSSIEERTQFSWWTKRIHPDDVQFVTGKITSHIENKSPYDVTYRIKHEDGDWRWWRSIGQACWDEADRAISMVGVNLDVTEQKTAQSAAENANRLKTEFLANMSHEIRTPLNGIIGMAQLLQRSDANEKQKKYIKSINSSGTSLLGIINNVLDISKIEAGVLELESEPFNIAHVVQQAADTVSGTAAQKGLTVDLNIDLPDEYIATGDANRLRQVLVNIAGNAVKFTEEGGIKLSATKKRTGVDFAIEDSGPGIAESEQEAIFGRFVQADGSCSRKHGGTGLGLAIAKDIVALMGGELKVLSQVGKGAKFYFTIPFASEVMDNVSANNDPPEDFTQSSGNSNNKINVLVAEDNFVNQEIVREALQHVEGVSAAFVENGKEAIELLGDSEFHLILMDINMPVLTGDEAIKIIRAQETQYNRIPIFVLTADASEDSHDKCIDIGADDCLTKPIDLDDLNTTVGILLKQPVLRNRLTSTLTKLTRHMSPSQLKEREERTRCNVPADLHFTDGGSLLCRVVNINTGGACLHVAPEIDMPNLFRMSFDWAKLSLLCRLAWRQGDRAGIQFVIFQKGTQRTKLLRLLDNIEFSEDCPDESEKHQFQAR